MILKYSLGTLPSLSPIHFFRVQIFSILAVKSVILLVVYSLTTEGRVSKLKSGWSPLRCSLSRLLISAPMMVLIAASNWMGRDTGTKTKGSYEQQNTALEHQFGGGL
jgi:hypothetical protein